ncbi:MAG: signal recognition particle-docking protein FtsY [Gammaproteobacteria bacterium]|nr:MAG: signal recognition particle-docking protein FtsY [Gammaproteobacteria bacterium]
MLKFLRGKKKDSKQVQESGSPPEIEASHAPEADNIEHASAVEPQLEKKPQPEDEPQPNNEPQAEAPQKKKGLFSRLKEKLSKTRHGLTDGLSNLLLGKKQLDDDLLEELETRLLLADVGVETTMGIIDRLTERLGRKELSDDTLVINTLREEMGNILLPCTEALDVTTSKPFVILVVGVNGVGKTTTIGKLAKKFQQQGQSVMLAAGDTFRAAAVEQLEVWGERNQIPVVAQHTGADSASVIFDAFQAAKARNIDVLIADTAGRLHTKDNLMEELKKIQRVIKKIDDNAPNEVLLVLDASTGQNALSQATTFNSAIGLTGVALTKLDGTAKGGIIFAIADKLKIPIRFIGIGEGIEDLREFDGKEFVAALFNEGESE